MSRTVSSSVLPIQRAMASATPSAWRDGVVIDFAESAVTVAFLDGAVATLHVVGAVGELVAGEPIAYHPVAEILDASRHATTARAA